MSGKYCKIQKLVPTTERTEKWWEELSDSKAKGWTTLRHNGVVFPPGYEPLPPNVTILYDGKPLKLDHSKEDNSFHVSAEEAMVFFATQIERDERLFNSGKKTFMNKDDKVFVKNFFTDWKEILSACGENRIKDFRKIDFTPVVKYLSEKNDKRKEERMMMGLSEKEIEKREKDAIKSIYGYALVDGVLLPVGNYTVQPPMLFLGHGEAPLRGKIKGRVVPEDVTINVSRNYIPKCSYNGSECKWGEVIENREVWWIASYKSPVTGKMAYVSLDRKESPKVCINDMTKFDKARKLNENIHDIREKYTRDLRSKDEEVRLLATAVYLLDVLAIRPGADKDETKEAGTLGLTTLKCENVTMEDDGRITVNFIGKSSIEFIKTFDIDETVYKILYRRLKNCEENEKLFPSLTPQKLNEYLKKLLPGLTAKVFRTWKASSILQEHLNRNVPNPDDEEYRKKLLFERANIEVAKELNHKRMVAKDERVSKIESKLKELKKKASSSKTPSSKKSMERSIAQQKLKLLEAQSNISTATSKANYLDPRIIVAWAKKGDVPIEKIYNKATLLKFIWAMGVEPDWQF